MIHHTVTFEQLATIDTPPPYRLQGESPTWAPIPHKDLVSSFLDALVSRDYWHVYDPLIILSKDKRVMSLIVPMHIKGGSSNYSLLLGMTNSNTNHGGSAVKMYAGVRTDVETWLMRMPFKIMHLQTIKIQDEAKIAVNKVFLPQTKRIEHEIAVLQSEEISRGDAERLLMEAGRNKILPWTRIGVAVNLFDKSEPNKWELLKSFSFALNKSPANQQMEKAVKFKRMLP